jgi:hypothetical protein
MSPSMLNTPSVAMRPRRPAPASALRAAAAAIGLRDFSPLMALELRLAAARDTGRYL